VASPAGFESEASHTQAGGTTETAENPGDGDPRSSAIVDPKDHSRPNEDLVEAALAHALRGASDAGQWDAVATLARELQARREARAGVVDLEMARKRRGTP